MLIARGRPEDGERLRALLNQAVAIFDDLGMRYDLARAVGMRLELQGVSSASPQASIDMVVCQVDRQKPDLSQTAAPDGTAFITKNDAQ